MITENIGGLVGNTPLLRIGQDWGQNVNLYAKLEYYNPTGSVKDRAASFVLRSLFSKGLINPDTIIVESSSGNFGVALSAFCKQLNLKFYCVVDPLISSTNERIIKNCSTKMFKINQPDENGGYLKSRLAKVKELIQTHKNSYWINQYANPINSEGYRSLGEELISSLPQIDFVFVGVSSGGTITGVSRKIKEVFSEAKIIAVDTVGSVIFGGAPSKRYIPGIGSSRIPEILEHAQIDDVVMVEETESIEMCYELLGKNQLFVGGSSGSVYAAARRYLKDRTFSSEYVNAVLIFPDKGDRYSETVYNLEWLQKTYPALERVSISALP